jgi:hypothetical protein
MNDGGRGKKMRFKRNLSIIVVATLLLSFISTAIVTPAQGKSKRVAVITELKGSATVKSAGGSREYDAYPDMGLNQGDYITTESNSSVKVVIKDRNDEFTIGSNAVVSISILADKGKDKKSKLKLLSGSVWSNVNKLSGGDDYEVETPTAVMAVRGTKVLTNVNSETGETYVAVAAGTVAAKTNDESNANSNSTSSTKNKEILIAPSQQLSLDSRSEVDNLETKVDLIDPAKLVSGTSSEIIEAIVKDKQSIDEENAAFIASQKEKIAKGDVTGISRGEADSSLSIKDLSALDKVTKNLDNLIGNVVNKAIEDKKVDKEQINKIIDDVNKNITDQTKKLDLGKVVPMDKTAGVDEALQKVKEEQLKKLEEAKKTVDEAKKAADEAAKLKLAEALKKLEEEKTRIAKEKEVLGLTKPTPIPTPKVSIAPIATPGSSGPTPSTPAPTLTATMTVSGVVYNDSNLELDNYTDFDINVNIQNITDSDQVYGVEVHVVWGKDIKIDQPNPSSIPTPTPFSQFFDSTHSVIRYSDIYGGSSQSEIIYAAVLPYGFVPGNNQLVNIPLNFRRTYTDSTEILVYVKVIKKDGNVLINKMIEPLSVKFTPKTVTPYAPG